jgi:hypothetical protein
VVPATDSCVTLARRSYWVDGRESGLSTSILRLEFFIVVYHLQLTVLEIKAPERKVDDGWILLFDKCVFGEPFEMKNDIRRKTLALKAFQLTCKFLPGGGFVRRGAQ